MKKMDWDLLERRFNMLQYIGVLLMVVPFVGGIFLGWPDFLIVIPGIGMFLFGISLGGLACRKYIMKRYPS